MPVSGVDGSPKRLLQQSSGPILAPPVGSFRVMLQAVVQQAVEAQFVLFLGAGPYERTAARQGLRNGSRTRWLVTLLGKIEILIPRDRAGAFSPTLFVRYQRHEQALFSTLAECYLQAVSTREVRHIVEQLCGETVSASAVSRPTKQLDTQLAAWRARKLDAVAYPHLGIDANYVCIRRGGQVLSTAVLWVLGVAANGYREYFVVWLGTAESGPVWSPVFKDLHARGLYGVSYVERDEAQGLK